MSTRRNPVFWTDLEAQQLAEAAWILRPPQERLDPLGWARWVTQAQAKVLPNDRRKFIAGMHMIKPVMVFIKKLQSYKGGDASEQESQPNAAIQAVVDEFNDARREQRLKDENVSNWLKQETAKREPAHEQARPNYGRPGLAPLNPDEIRVIVNVVLDVIEERVRSYFIRHPPIASADNAPATAKPEIAPAEMPHVRGWADAARQSVEQRIADGTALKSAESTERSLRIGVVGFDAREQEQIARGLNQKVKLTFAYPHHHSKSAKLIDKVAGCNAIFVRVKWTSHAHIAALKKQLSTKCHFLENQPNAIKCADVINEWLKYTQAR